MRYSHKKLTTFVFGREVLNATHMGTVKRDNNVILILILARMSF